MLDIHSGLDSGGHLGVSLATRSTRGKGETTAAFSLLIFRDILISRPSIVVHVVAEDTHLHQHHHQSPSSSITTIINHHYHHQ
jgi:hypothetical protein